MNGKDLQKYCRLNKSSEMILRQAITQLKLSPRAYDRILKVARTIADLANSENILSQHLFEAINYRRTALMEI